MSGPVAAVTLATTLFFLALIHRWMLLIMMPFLCTYLLVSLRRIMLARRRPLAIEGNVLVQRDASGREIGRVILDRPFEIEYLQKGYFNALYRITQGEVALVFTQQTAGAEHLVRDVLELQWPPFGRAWV